MKSPLKILITAGPTREMLDPVRFISNLSTGSMGYALAREALKRGHQVTLISGPTHLKPPAKAKLVSIDSTMQLKKACEAEFKKNDVLIMTAAVCDYFPEVKYGSKIKRSETQTVILKQTPDIISGVAKKKKKSQKVIGFCLESEDWVQKAIKKCKKKQLDGIVANYVSKSHNPFGARSIKTALVRPGGETEMLPKWDKVRIARRILSWLD